MNYKGAYDGSTEYSLGDVAVYTDGVAYVTFKAPPTGTPCHDAHYWERLIQPFQEIVVMFHNKLNGLSESAAAADSVIFDGNTLVLGVEGSETKYAVTVDATGDTPDVVASAITDGD